MSVFEKYDPNFRIEVWTFDKPEIRAGAESLSVAIASFEAECLVQPKAIITLRQGARVLRRHDPSAKINPPSG